MIKNLIAMYVTVSQQKHHIISRFLTEPNT